MAVIEPLLPLNVAAVCSLFWRPPPHLFCCRDRVEIFKPLVAAKSYGDTPQIWLPGEVITSAYTQAARLFDKLPEYFSLSPEAHCCKQSG